MVLSHITSIHPSDCQPLSCIQPTGQPQCYKLPAGAGSHSGACGGTGQPRSHRADRGHVLVCGAHPCQGTAHQPVRAALAEGRPAQVWRATACSSPQLCDAVRAALSPSTWDNCHISWVSGVSCMPMPTLAAAARQCCRTAEVLPPLARPVIPQAGQAKSSAPRWHNSPGLPDSLALLPMQ